MCDLCGPDRALQVIDHSIDHPFELEPGTDLDCRTCGRHVSAHPDKLEFLAKRTMGNIIDHQVEVRVVGASEDHPPFAYSIGRTVADRPELLVTGGLGPQMLGYIINRVTKLDDGTLAAGQELDEVLEGYTVRLVAVRDLEEAQMFGVTNNFGTEDTSALQVLWPDAQGRFPNEPGYDERLVQPVYA